MVRSFAILAALVVSSIARADQPPSALEIEQRVEARLQAEVEKHCSTGAALDQAFCFKERLDALDKELDGLIDRAIAETKNMWGPVATAEQGENIRKAEAAWKTYRHEHCWFAYVPHQQINASSAQLDNIVCEIRRVFRRMEEVKIDYMFDWQ